MPPRRSCFLGCPQPPIRPAEFQCHHGVPASSVPTRRSPGDPEFQCHHGVPASDLGKREPAQGLEFQCHHGVPDSNSGHLGPCTSGRVSMPPRRSCFWDIEIWRSCCIRGFNATTAFLLRSGWTTGQNSSRRFNATTAFLLLLSCSSGFAKKIQFQCHHGVPASFSHPYCDPLWGGFNATTAFLLEARYLTLRLFRNVSMPPRRSCLRLFAGSSYS